MKKVLIGIGIALAVLFLFMLLVPCVRKIEKLDPKTAAGGEGAFIQLGNKTNIHYIEKGAGDKNIILLHGFSSSVYTWKDNIDALAKTMHVYAIDMIGYGFSDKPAGIEYTYDTFADTLLEFMDKKGIKTAALCGNSMGGGIAIRFAAKHPERVEKLILVDSAGYKHKGTGAIALLGAPIIGRFLFSANSPSAMARIMKKLCFYDKSKVTPERVAAYYKTFRVKGAAMAASNTVREMKNNTLQDDITGIKKPTLIIWGDKDALIDPINATYFNSDIQGSKLVTIPKCGHMPQEEKPEEFNKAVIEFMGK
jgi:pimeloyl-ACP methyl ester carboxylesterase